MQAVILCVVVIIAAISGGAYYYLTSTTPKQYLTLATWAGTYVDALTPIVNSFTNETGIEVKYFLQSSSGQTATKILAERDSPTIDLFMSATGTIISTLIPAGMCANITSDKVPNLSTMTDAAVAGTPNYLPIYGVYEGWIIYPDIIPQEHAFNGSLTWFFDPALKGKIAVGPESWPLSSFWFCLLAHDLGLTNSTHDLVAAATAAKMLAPNIKLVFSSEAELEQLFAAKEIWAAPSLFTDVKALNDQGVPVQALKVVPDSHTYLAYTSIGVVKGGKEDLALKFLNYLIASENLGPFAYALGNAPLNKQPVSPPVGLAPYVLSGSELDYVWYQDYAWSASVINAWTTVWDIEVKPLL